MHADSVNSFHKVYNAFYRKSFLFARSYVHNDPAAEDIASEALIKLWERMKNETIDPIAPLLFTILKNSALDYLKHQTIQRLAIDSITKSLHRELEIRTTALEACDPTAIFSTEVEQIFQSTLETLPERTREIFTMSRFGRKSHKEIAEFFGITVKGVDYHISQAVRQLKITLRDFLPFLGSWIYLN